jgi:hypothetical protein
VARVICVSEWGARGGFADFTTTTDASLRWPRDVYEGGQGARWRPQNVRRPEPGFTLTFKNDIGTKEVVQPKTTDAKSCHYTLEQEPGRPIAGRATTEAFSQYNAPRRYALNMQPDERYMLQKDKNQSVLPQQCGLPGPRVRVLNRGKRAHLVYLGHAGGIRFLPGGALITGGGAMDWKQHTEEVITSEAEYRLNGQGPHATDYKWTADPKTGRQPEKPKQSFTVRYMSDIGTQERKKTLTPAELIRCRSPRQLSRAPWTDRQAAGSLVARGVGTIFGSHRGWRSRLPVARALGLAC